MGGQYGLGRVSSRAPQQPQDKLLAPVKGLLAQLAGRGGQGPLFFVPPHSRACDMATGVRGALGTSRFSGEAELGEPDKIIQVFSAFFYLPYVFKVHPCIRISFLFIAK